MKLLLILIAVVLVGCKEEKKPEDKTTISRTCDGGMCIYTILHDGHLFVHAYQGGIIHHPNCSCFR